MSEFTKGPWTARHPLGMEGMYHVFIYGSAGKKVKLGRMDGYVDGTCCGEKGYPDKAETVANAHLIAESPTMFEYIKTKADSGCSEAKEIISKITLDS